MSITSIQTQSADFYAPIAGGDGNPTYSGTPSSAGVACRAEEKRVQLQSSDKTVVVTDTLVFAPADLTVDNGYKMVLDGYDYVVDDVAPVRSRTAMSHKELLCRRLGASG